MKVRYDNLGSSYTRVSHPGPVQRRRLRARGVIQLLELACFLTMVELNKDLHLVSKVSLNPEVVFPPGAATTVYRPVQD